MATKLRYDEFKRFLDQRLPAYMDLLKRMVDINSFTANYAGVNRLLEETAEVFATLGFAAERVPSSEALYGDHLFLRRPAVPDGDQPTIGFVSHLDTVFPPGEERQNDFVWREEGDRIYGPGTVDIKGGTIVIYMILDALRHVEPQLYDGVNWLIMLNAAEEVLLPQFGHLCRQRLPADSLACLVYEGGRIREGEVRVVTARKGMATYRIEVEGRAAHAGSAHGMGANAIVEMGHLIADIAALTDYDRRLTYNIGTVIGGSVLNRVPHHAAASGEMRAFHPEIMEEGVERLLGLAKNGRVSSRRGHYPCKIDIEVLNQWNPWPKNQATEALADSYEQAAAAMGLRLTREHRGGLSDGNLLWKHVPTLDGLGPAGGNAHCSERSPDGSKEQEFVRRSSFIPKATLSALAIVTLLQRERPGTRVEVLKP